MPDKGVTGSEKTIKEGIEVNKQKLIDAGYSESDAEDLADEFEQGGVKVSQKVKDILTNKKEGKEGMESSDLKKGDTVEYEGNKYKIGDFDTAGGANLVYLNTMNNKPAEDSKGRYKKVHKSRVKKIN